jgi:hypothetical protein
MPTVDGFRQRSAIREDSLVQPTFAKNPSKMGEIRLRGGKPKQLNYPTSIWPAPCKGFPRAGEQAEETMNRIDQACREVVDSVDGALACGVVDLVTGMVLGIYPGTGPSSELNDVVATVGLEMFRNDENTRLERLVESSRGSKFDEPYYFDEVDIASSTRHHFAKTIKEGKAALLLVTEKTANIGMGWAHVKSAVHQLEPHVP